MERNFTISTGTDQIVLCKRHFSRTMPEIHHSLNRTILWPLHTFEIAIGEGSPTSQMDSTSRIKPKRGQKKGVSLTVMLCGGTGSGKSSFVETMCGFQTNLLGRDELVLSHLSMIKSAQIPDQSTFELPLQFEQCLREIHHEDLGTLSVNFIETHGLGDSLENEPAIDAVVKYLELQYQTVLMEESKIKRNPRFKDNRVHALLYFINPTGHGLNELDILFLKRVTPLVNVIPVLARGDTLTTPEIDLNRRLIKEDLQHYKLSVYIPPDMSGHFDLEDDESRRFSRLAPNTRAEYVFVVVNASQVIENPSDPVKKLPVREYPWGVVDVFDAKVSDMLELNQILFDSHTIDLRDSTTLIHYERFRTSFLTNNLSDSSSGAGAGAAGTVAGAADSVAPSGDSNPVSETNAADLTADSTTAPVSASSATNNTITSSSSTTSSTADRSDVRSQRQSSVVSQELKARELDSDSRDKGLQARRREIAQLQEELRARDLERAVKSIKQPETDLKA